MLEVKPNRKATASPAKNNLMIRSRLERGRSHHSKAAPAMAVARVWPVLAASSNFPL
jgi:hypothetical protein